MKHVVFDCDNTFGVKDCDVDDGLALMYLLGCPEAKVHGITATYGNNRLDIVYNTSRNMLKELGRVDIPVKMGGEKCGAYESEAADYLAEMADKYAGALSILATGSLTNLRGAYERDNHFFEKVKEIVVMGGITSPLVFEKKVMNELNFSCDPFATWTVLTKGKNVSVITGNHCLKVLFTREEYKERLFGSDNRAAEFIREKTDYWFGYNEEDYGIGGFYNWDVTAAVYLMNPELFVDERKALLISTEDLKRGYLQEAEKGNCVCNLPVIDGEKAFKDHIYDAWMRVPMD
ncbi:nucleoside hydrolase [Lacrimispora sphenoides]|uniref:Inosine-uridine nucleoside N-ribohydrolase n=1 Tax=Lacrimispora sphenoides JCM 1415 TaxID=1297793 RepID=A0ABY1C2E0_9FIRM|nr:nucleoside hydrolase [Lacrimispora sphenoides]SET56600.1 Inosine-uridine nucleoside N-ribohydrolase [[Clostridium] sphenoides JCM 1415]SUY49794.1 nucleoside hydrolase, IUNH family [Lacrimispora sphenoides]